MASVDGGGDYGPAVVTRLEDAVKLGEGPTWSQRTNRLYWLDIEGHQLHTFDPSKNSDASVKLPGLVSCLAECESDTGKFICGTDCGLAWLKVTPDGGLATLEMVMNPEPFAPTNRFNDGKCDCRGRFYAGTMSNVRPRVTGAASLYCITPRPPGLFAKRVDSVGAVTVSNGLAWSADSSKMYYIDTPTRKIQTFSFDVESGEVGSKLGEFVLPADIPGSPDGMTIDAEGKLWVALFRGGRIIRLDPDKNAIVSTHMMPTPHITSCCFGGDDLRTLYITSAIGSGVDAQASQGTPAGTLMALHTSVQGTPMHTFHD
ncbi:SMP-30/gluconolactonase/LRE family protein [Pelomyxa schiedti]|nr:SMP-30/gluconolactonase/LRE family protein [Pelomyxa schiedti]